MHDTYDLVKTNLGFVVFRNGVAVEIYPTAAGTIQFVTAHLGNPYTIFACTEMARVIEFFYVTENFLPFVSVKIASPLLLSLEGPGGASCDITCSYDATVHPALGGPRELTPDDFLYAVANLSLDARPKLDIFPIMQRHSFWIPANWYNVADTEALARLMAYIGDPRWYLVDSPDDDRYEQLYRLLKLRSRRNFFRAFAHNAVDNPALLAFRSWFSHAALQRSIDGTEDSTNEPGSFFLDRLCNHYGVSGDQFVSVLFDVTREFVAVFCELWAHFLTHRSAEDIQYLPVDLGKFSGFYQDYVKPLFPVLVGQDAA